MTRLIEPHRERVQARARLPSRSRIGTRVDSRPATGAAKNETTLSGRKTQPGLQRRQPEDVLQVERQVEEHREHRRRDRERGDLRADERGRRKSARSTIVVRSTRLRGDEQARAARGRRPGEPTMSVLVQPCELPSISARIRQNRPPVSVTSPIGSSRLCSGSLDSWSCAAESAIAAIPIGMLTRKIQRQREPGREHRRRRAARSRPPRRSSRPRSPNAVPRSRPWNSWESSASAVANIIAPPTPWTPRAMIRKSASLDSPQAAEAIVNRIDRRSGTAACGRRGRRASPAVRTKVASASA